MRVKKGRAQGLRPEGQGLNPVSTLGTRQQMRPESGAESGEPRMISSDMAHRCDAPSASPMVTQGKTRRSGPLSGRDIARLPRDSHGAACLHDSFALLRNALALSELGSSY